MLGVLHDLALHGGHPQPQQPCLLQPLPQLLLPQLVLDVEAEGDGTLVLLAVPGVVAAQGDLLGALGGHIVLATERERGR